MSCLAAGDVAPLPKITALVVVLLVEIVTFSILAPAFLTRANFLNVLTAIAVTGIVAMPGTLLIIAGQFDLSVASIIALSGVAMATAAEGHSMPLAIVVAFAVGILAGAVNGFLVTVVGVNALITTLGMFSVLRGLARVIADGLSVSVQDFSTLGTSRPLGIPLPVVDLPRGRRECSRSSVASRRSGGRCTPSARTPRRHALPGSGRDG